MVRFFSFSKLVGWFKGDVFDSTLMEFVSVEFPFPQNRLENCWDLEWFPRLKQVNQPAGEIPVARRHNQFTVQIARQLNVPQRHRQTTSRGQLLRQLDQATSVQVYLRKVTQPSCIERSRLNIGQIPVARQVQPAQRRHVLKGRRGNPP